MRNTLIVYIALLALTGCSISDLPFIYTPDKQQGTALHEDRVDQLEPGLSRRQVRFLLGTPDITDPFHPNRWDYVYSLVPGDGGEPQSERLTVYFDGDRLVGAKGSYIKPGNPLTRGVPTMAGR